MLADGMARAPIGVACLPHCTELPLVIAHDFSPTLVLEVRLRFAHQYPKHHISQTRVDDVCACSLPGVECVCAGPPLLHQSVVVCCQWFMLCVRIGVCAACPALELAVGRIRAVGTWHAPGPGGGERRAAMGRLRPAQGLPWPAAGFGLVCPPPYQAVRRLARMQRACGLSCSTGRPRCCSRRPYPHPPPPCRRLPAL